MIKINISKCVGCRSCEIICSYHHKQCFSPKYSSIEISFDNDYNINVAIADNCDCTNHEAICVDFCPVNAIEILK